MVHLKHRYLIFRLGLSEFWCFYMVQDHEDPIHRKTTIVWEWALKFTIFLKREIYCQIYILKGNIWFLL